LDILKRGGVEMSSAKQGNSFRVGTNELPNNTMLVRLDQPYGAFAKSLLEVQKYPNLRDAEGHPIAPYDVTAHTLPLLMHIVVQPGKAPVKPSPSRSAAPRPTADIDSPGFNPPAKKPCFAPTSNLPALYR